MSKALSSRGNRVGSAAAVGDLDELAGLLGETGEPTGALEGEPGGRDPFEVEKVELTTVGIDVGSSTSHLMVSRILLQRQAQSLSSRFVLVRRKVLWRSPIELTPYKADDTIDAATLAAFVVSGYEAAGIEPGEIDTGAVILTGEALKRKNARSIAEALAGESGRFVCASAGHHLEATLAAHGSGAVALSEERKAVVVHVDIGGGTTKLAVIENGIVTGTAALEVGGRIAVLEGRRIVRLADAAKRVADACGLRVALEEELEPGDEDRLAEALAGALTAMVNGEQGDLAGDLLVTEPLDPFVPDVVTFSGGVAEYVHGREQAGFSDLGPALGRELRRAIDGGRLRAPVEELAPGIRATVIGASQFSVALSGSTVGVDETVLPLRNLVALCASVDGGDDVDPGAIAAQLDGAARRLDLEPGGEQGLGSVAIGIAIAWRGDPEHARLAALAEGLSMAANSWTATGQPLVVLTDADIGRSLHRILTRELGYTGPLVCLDGIVLGELDYVDVGQVIWPAGVVPVVVRSLLFSSDDGRSGD